MNNKKLPNGISDNYNTADDVCQKFSVVWNDLIGENLISKQTNPKAFLLGGQPGAGKSFAITEIKKQLQSNVLVINGDEYRSYHKHYDDYFQVYGKDAAKHTGEFAGKMVENVRDQAIKNNRWRYC